MHQPCLPRHAPLQGLRTPQALSAIGRRAEGRKGQGDSGQERGHGGQGFGRLKNKVTRPDAYRPKDNNDTLLSERLEQLCRFFP